MKSKKRYLALSVRAPLPVRAILEALVHDHPSSGIEEREDGFLACFPEGTSCEEVRNIMTIGEERIRASGISAAFDITLQEIPFTDWSVRWMDRFSRVETGERLVIMAPWHNRTPGRVPVIIEPSMAFGTGEHPTTRLCLEAVEQCAGYLNYRSLLDIGTGTGILAIAAAKLGFFHITAIDTDPDAVEIARENIRINNTPDIVVTGERLETVPGTFDVIVGNLTAKAVRTLVHDCIKRLNRGGTGIFSGILEEQKDAMLSFFRSEGMRVMEVRQCDGWCAFIARRPSK
jgi:ribosomal protein L11 methyltransferase